MPLFPTRAPLPALTSGRCASKSRCSGAFARTNELMSVSDRGYRLPDLIREGCSGGHIDLPFLGPSRPRFPYSICMHATCPRDTRPMGCHPSFSVWALMLEQVSILGLSIDGRSGSVLADVTSWTRRCSCSCPGSAPIIFFVRPCDDLQFALEMWQQPAIV